MTTELNKDYFEQTIARIMDENKRLNNRIEEVEQELKKQADIRLSIERLAINSQSILSQLESQSARIKRLEEAPMETNKKVRDALVNTIIAGTIGAILAKLLTML